MMNALVFWTQSKTTSIVEENDLCPNVEEDKLTMVLYNNKKYKAKVMKKSYDREYLKTLSVSKNGTLLIKNSKVVRKEVLLKKKEIKKKEKVNKQNQAECSYSAGVKLAASKSVFSSSDEDNKCQTSEDELAADVECSDDEREDLEEIKRIQEELQEEKESQRDFEREFEQDLENERRELEQENERQREEEEPLRERQREEEGQARERQREEEERARERQREVRVREGQREEEERARERQREVRAREGQREAWARQHQRGQNRHERQYDEDDIENEDPLEECRRPGQGKVQLCRVFNVWIGEADLTYLQRWLEFPKEMTRRLLKILVGRNNLKHMCARGRSKTNRMVPEDVMNAVEYYVNHKCSSKLKPAEFSTTVNMMCASLRNPKP